IGRGLLATSSALALLCAGDLASAQTTLPGVVVQQPKPAAKPAAKRTAAPPPAAPAAPAPVETPEAAAARAVAEKNQFLNEKRDNNLLNKVGTNLYEMNRAAVDALPQGANTPIDKVLLQAPGVTQDSAASGSLHV